MGKALTNAARKYSKKNIDEVMRQQSGEHVLRNLMQEDSNKNTIIGKFFDPAKAEFDVGPKNVYNAIKNRFFKK